jgi:hypothetical protein
MPRRQLLAEPSTPASPMKEETDVPDHRFEQSTSSMYLLFAQ